jgi:hypothetical protein
MLLCVISAQQRVAQWRTGTNIAASSSFCVRKVQYQWMFITDWSVCSVMTVCSVFRDGRSSTGDLAHPDHPPHSVDPDTQATRYQMVQCCCYIMLWHISEHLGISLERASHHHTHSGLLTIFCSMGAEQFKRRTDGNSIGHLLGTSAVVWRRGRQVLGSYCWRMQVLVFALWSRDCTHVSAVETSIISLTEKESHHTLHQ